MLYFLHRDACLSAGALGDAQTGDAIKECGELLSTAYRLTLLSDSIQLYNAHIITHPHLWWVVNSIEHAAWLTSYYSALTSKYRAISRVEHPAQKLLPHFEGMLNIFPRKRWADPLLVNNGLIVDDKTVDFTAFYRRLFLTNLKPGQYKRVKPPFWVEDFKRVRDASLLGFPAV